MRERSLEEMSAIGKNLGLAAVFKAGGNERKNLNLPTIFQKEASPAKMSTCCPLEDKFYTPKIIPVSNQLI